jgi:hypothetical protein
LAKFRTVLIFSKWSSRKTPYWWSMRKRRQLTFYSAFELVWNSEIKEKDFNLIWLKALKRCPAAFLCHIWCHEYSEVAEKIKNIIKTLIWFFHPFLIYIRVLNWKKCRWLLFNDKQILKNWSNLIQLFSRKVFQKWWFTFENCWINRLCWHWTDK